MTKTEYAQYLQSPHWKELREEFLQECGSDCKRCKIPRWLAELIYDQDIHVHHKTYENLGAEELDDLEALCRRCHEIETFGRSDLPEIRSTSCELCGKTHWDMRSELCAGCRLLSSDTPDLYLKLQIQTLRDSVLNILGLVSNG